MEPCEGGEEEEGLWSIQAGVTRNNQESESMCILLCCPSCTSEMRKGMGLFLKAAALTLPLGERRKLEA